MANRTDPKHDVASTIPRFAWVLLGLSLIYWAWLVFDLMMHPFDAGARSELVTPYLYRWLSGITGSITVIVGLILLRRVRTNLIVLLMILYAIGSTSWSMRWIFSTPAITTWANLGKNVYFFLIGYPSISVLLWHFPDGKIHPPSSVRQFRMLMVFYLLAIFFLILGFSPTPGAALQTANLPVDSGLETWANAIGILILLVLQLSGVISLVRRYRAGSPRVQSQIKWMVWLAGIGILTFIPTGILLFSVAGHLYWFTFPFLAVVFAIQKNQLWDIDQLIRRSLIYGLLTAALALIYFGSVLVLQQVFNALTEQASPAAIVISTLAIATLFNPLRRRIQAFIDRQFYRQKYDSERLVQDFSQRLRAGGDIEELSQHLVATTREALQPEQISLWMRSREGR